MANAARKNKKKIASPIARKHAAKRSPADQNEHATEFEAFAARRARTAQVVTRKIERLLRTGR
jgi:hypothetical protein